MMEAKISFISVPRLSQSLFLKKLSNFIEVKQRDFWRLWEQRKKWPSVKQRKWLKSGSTKWLSVKMDLLLCILLAIREIAMWSDYFTNMEPSWMLKINYSCSQFMWLPKLTGHFLWLSFVHMELTLIVWTKKGRLHCIGHVTKGQERLSITF